ncbi:dienelactone hydrolase family protein [Spirosoma litoris]
MNVQYHNQVSIPVEGIRLTGELYIPQHVNGMIVFAHGSGSSRLSQRNQYVVQYLQERNFGTLLFDLLTEAENKNYFNRFAIDLLKERLVFATNWLEQIPAARNIPIGYFGASTGAAAALKASVDLPQIAAVVSRGGRPDLIEDEVSAVKVPTLLIVGSLDHQVLELNQEAYGELCYEKRLEIVEGATHLFEEPGKLEIVAELAANWFNNHMPVKMS